MGYPPVLDKKKRKEEGVEGGIGERADRCVQTMAVFRQGNVPSKNIRTWTVGDVRSTTRDVRRTKKHEARITKHEADGTERNSGLNVDAAQNSRSTLHVEQGESTLPA